MGTYAGWLAGQLVGNCRGLFCSVEANGTNEGFRNVFLPDANALSECGQTSCDFYMRLFDALPLLVEAAEPQVKSKDLSDVLELIQSIKTQQNKLKEELRELKRKRGMLTGKPEPETKEARPVSPSPYRLGCRPVYLAPLPAKDTLRTNHEVAHKVATVKHEASLAERSNAIRTRRENHIASLPEYEPKKKKAPKGTGSPLDGRAKDLLQEVYKEIHEAIDEYVDDLVRREFSNKGTDDDTDAETDPPN